MEMRSDQKLRKMFFLFNNGRSLGWLLASLKCFQVGWKFIFLIFLFSYFYMLA